MNKIRARLLRLEVKSDNIIISSALKLTVKKYCLIISNNGNVLPQLLKIYC